jgi:hypothetical protein
MPVLRFSPGWLPMVEGAPRSQQTIKPRQLMAASCSLFMQSSNPGTKLPCELPFETGGSFRDVRLRGCRDVDVLPRELNLSDARL